MARYTLFFPALLILTGLPAFVSSSELASRASEPATCFSCPAQGGFGFALGVHDEGANPIFCSYPAVEGEDPNDFFCTYSPTTGQIVQDNNGGFCPGQATSKGCALRRNDNFKAMKRGAEARAAHPRSMRRQNRSSRALQKKWSA